MPQLSTYTLPQLTDLVERSYETEKKSLPQQMMKSGIVVDDTMEMHTGKYKRFAEHLDTNEYTNTRDEGDVSSEGKVQYGYEKDLVIKTETKVISITEEMRSEGKEPVMIRQITDLTQAPLKSVDLDLAHRLSFAWSTSYVDRSWKTIDTTTGDGKAVIDPAHTLTGSGVTYSTQILGNPQFSKGALENAETSFTEGTFNNLWEKIECNPKVIVTTDDPNTCNQVNELMKATANVNSDNANTYNVYNNKYRHVEVARIATTIGGGVDTTKKKYWFLVDDRLSDFYISYQRRPYLKTPTDGNNGEIFSSEVWKYLTGVKYGIAIVTARWIRGSKGDGS